MISRNLLCLFSSHSLGPFFVHLLFDMLSHMLIPCFSCCIFSEKENNESYGHDIYPSFPGLRSSARIVSRHSRRKSEAGNPSSPHDLSAEDWEQAWDMVATWFMVHLPPV